MIRTSTLFILAAFAVTVSSTSITSPDVCLSNLDCPSTSFCNPPDVLELPQCLPRRPKNAICSLGRDECKQGLSCLFDESTREQLCLPRAPRGASCRLDATRPCVDSLVCERNTTTCQPFTDGFAGTPCQFDDHCQQDKGFYCQTEPGVCAPKRGPGGECNRAADNFECLGFCVTQFEGGTCISAGKEGDLCRFDDQCENRFFDRFDTRADLLICNTPNGFVGSCVRESRLISRLGASCDPHHDRCDARRTLSCHPTRDGDDVCQHRKSRFASEFQFSEHCEPQSPLSRCPWSDEKTECRLERDVPGESTPLRPGPYFVCRPKSEKVARGGVCITEFAACANGTECREVPGVKPRLGDLSTPFLPQRVAFCVHIAQQSESCGDVNDKFITQCKEGLRCEKGTCGKAERDEAPFDETVTHAGLRTSCSDLPCAPGLVCKMDEFDSTKRCLLPLRVVGKGRACANRAVERQRCEDGLVCVFRKDGTNVRRCQEPREAGDYCQGDDDCVEGLVCPSVWTDSREQEARRCYDPKTTLSLGETCDPEASTSEASCVVTEQPDEFFPSDKIPFPMRCVPKGDGFACRVIKGLFEFCDEEKDIACDSGLKCGNLGICVSVGEA